MKKIGLDFNLKGSNSLKTKCFILKRFEEYLLGYYYKKISHRFPLTRKNLTAVFIFTLNFKIYLVPLWVKGITLLIITFVFLLKAFGYTKYSITFSIYRLKNTQNRR